MSSDIVLDDQVVTVQGSVLLCQTSDLVLDNEGRRGPKNRSASRRALVHDQRDGLTLNFNGDYPGGVTINGQVNVPETVSADTVSATTFVIQGQGEVIHQLLHSDLRLDLDLMDEINALRSKISDLQTRVAVLEKK
jgi:hypothetical protein